MIYAAILGYGTIGSGVAKVFATNEELIAKRVGDTIKVKRILDLREFPGDENEALITHDFNDILNDSEISIVVETMGGLKPAYDFVKQCLLAGKSVCSSNKELVAKYGPELIAVAKEKNINFLFEASCGGGIPIIRPLCTSLLADDVDEITGILNGTTNFILTKMADEGQDYAAALKEAQDLGYAEKNPEADVEGYDPCRKIAILSSLANGKTVDFEKIYTEGITKISATDISYMKALNKTIKLLAMGKKVAGRFYGLVSPFAVDNSHPIAGVKYAFNAIFVHGNMLGDAMFYGSGAGSLPTASAVSADVIDAAKHLNENMSILWSEEELTVNAMDDFERAFFVRVKDSEEGNVKAVFGDVEKIKISEAGGEFGFITKVMKEKDFAALADKCEIVTRIRVY